ncbi:hypothetical protein, partial [Rhodoblastus acidophilus]|uniref:hypothetical protein n=1 Tax=Rhodoblastus acidophilus TaxID=1074 RepID=UPI00222506F2
SKAWSAGLSLENEAKAAIDPAARVRLEALALLEREVLARLPKNELRPNDLVARARGRIGFSRGRAYAAGLFSSLNSEAARGFPRAKMCESISDNPNRRLSDGGVAVGDFALGS